VTRRWLLPCIVAVVGLAATVGVAAASGIRHHEAVRLVVYSVVGAAAAGVVADLVLRGLRRSGFATQVAIAALAPVLAVAIGVVWAASGMFIMRHDVRVLWTVLVGAGTAGAVTALVLGRRVAAVSRSLGVMARQLAEPGAPPTATGKGAPQELASLAAELERTATRLAHAQEQSAAAERSRRELVAWVSHDLRTPLAGIRAMVEALEDGVVDDPETVARYHRTMRQEADRLAGLVDDLFELSRIHAGALSLELERVALDELVSDAIGGASVAARAKGVVLRGEVPCPAPVVELSTPEMARVVRNLLDNAIRHTPTGGVIVVSARLGNAGRTAEVSVSDACGGIPDADLSQVFETSFRGDAARTPGDGGSGLGLAVARGLVEAHNGQISVRNEGAGCRFTVRLPLSR
jgi:signal transduction histidine kinase